MFHLSVSIQPDLFKRNGYETRQTLLLNFLLAFLDLTVHNVQ